MTTTTILDLGAPATAKGVTARHLWVAGHEGRRVPGLVLTPDGATGQRPVIALGHGIGGSKDDPQMLQIARWFVRREGWAVAIIDGPAHGERAPAADAGETARQELARRETYDAMAVDWQRTLDACAELPDVGVDQAAYLGFSMGTMLGIPTVAAETRFTCAVLAIGGLPDGAEALGEIAKGIDRPVLMINQADDETFSRKSAFRLYDALSGPKRVFFFPGAHSGVPREAMERVREFLRAHVAGDDLDDDTPRGTW